MNPTDPIPATLDGLGRELASVAQRVGSTSTTRTTVQTHPARLQGAVRGEGRRV
jgi:hypothetical protein